MSLDKHTPGPWIVTEYDGRGPMEVQSSENPGASLALVYAMNPEEIEPNAKLIASAPTLLKQNEKMREALEKAKIHFEVIEESFEGMDCAGILFDITEALK